MIRILVHDPEKQQTVSGSLPSSVFCLDKTPLLNRVLDNEQLLMWLDLETESIKSEQALLNRRIGLPMAAVRAFQCLQGPVLEERSGHVLLRFDELLDHKRNQSPKTLALGFFFSKRFLITRHAKPSPCSDLLRQELVKNPASVFQPALIAVRLAGTVAARYLTLLSSMEQHLDELISARGIAARDASAELSAQRAALDKLRLVISKHTALFQTLNTLDLDLSKEVRKRLIVLRGHLEQALRIAERYSTESGLEVA